MGSVYTLSYPLDLPTDPKPKNVTWEQVSVVSKSVSPFTGAQKCYAYNGQWWRCSFDLPPLQEAKAAEWTAMLLRLHGREGYFNFQPTETTPQNALSGSPTVANTNLSNTTSGGYEVDISGLTGSFTAGDWVQIGNCLHRVTVGGNTSIEIWPQLKFGVELGDAIIYTNPKGRFKLADNFQWDVDVAKFAGISLVIEEYVEGY